MNVPSPLLWEKVIRFAFQATRTTHDIDSSKLAEAGRDTILAGDGRPIRVKLYVPGNEKIQSTIVVVVAPRRPCRPSTESHSRSFGHVCEGAVVVVVVEPILAKIRHVKIGPAVIIIVSNGYSESPAFVGNAGLGSRVRKRAVVIIAKSMALGAGSLPLSAEIVEPFKR